MRTIALVSASLVMITLPVTDADAASNRWCATTPKRSENCGYATPWRKCEGRKSHAERNPELVALVRQLRENKNQSVRSFN
jgi:hypothetical protein